jgi:hypothetical protein
MILRLEDRCNDNRCYVEMSFRDVSQKFFNLQEKSHSLFKKNADGTIGVDVDTVLPWNALNTVNRGILNSASPDGLSLRLMEFDKFGWSKKDLSSSAEKLGKFYALERETGTTKLFLVWVPERIQKRLKNSTLRAPLNAHVLFHPPTSEHDYYKNTPYWDGVCSQSKEDASMQGKHTYLMLGVRYFANDYLSIAQHVLAVTDKQPLLMFVVPVADQGDFSDLMRPTDLMKMLFELYEFLSRDNGGKMQFDQIGKLMLSGYSRSGTKLETIISQVDDKPFFKDYLTQLNSFDVNLGNFRPDGGMDTEERMRAFRVYSSNLQKWNKIGGSKTRAFTYVAHPNLAPIARQFSPGAATEETTVPLENVSWSNEDKRKIRGEPRGVAVETYYKTRSWGVIHLPISFFEWYLANMKNDRGYRYDGLRGHGMFLRKMMLHALQHADPLFFSD